MVSAVRVIAVLLVLLTWITQGHGVGGSVTLSNVEKVPSGWTPTFDVLDGEQSGAPSLSLIHI